jgi:hypothetical protein
VQAVSKAFSSEGETGSREEKTRQNAMLELSVLIQSEPIILEESPAQIEAVGHGGEQCDDEHDTAKNEIGTERLDVNPPSCRPGNHLSKRSH